MASAPYRHVRFFIPKEAFAHAYVVSSNPAANEELEKQPPSVSITFSEGIESGFHAIKVLNAKGDRVDQGDTVIKDQKIMEAALKRIYQKEFIPFNGMRYQQTGTLSLA